MAVDIISTKEQLLLDDDEILGLELEQPEGEVDISNINFSELFEDEDDALLFGDQPPASFTEHAEKTDIIPSPPSPRFKNRLHEKLAPSSPKAAATSKLAPPSQRVLNTTSTTASPSQREAVSTCPSPAPRVLKTASSAAGTCNQSEPSTRPETPATSNLVPPSQASCKIAFPPAPRVLKTAAAAGTCNQSEPSTRPETPSPITAAATSKLVPPSQRVLNTASTAAASCKIAFPPAPRVLTAAAGTCNQSEPSARPETPSPITTIISNHKRRQQLSPSIKYPQQKYKDFNFSPDSAALLFSSLTAQRKPTNLGTSLFGTGLYNNSTIIPQPDASTNFIPNRFDLRSRLTCGQSQKTDSDCTSFLETGSKFKNGARIGGSTVIKLNGSGRFRYVPSDLNLPLAVKRPPYFENPPPVKKKTLSGDLRQTLIAKKIQNGGNNGEPKPLLFFN